MSSRPNRILYDVLFLLDCFSDTSWSHIHNAVFCPDHNPNTSGPYVHDIFFNDFVLLVVSVLSSNIFMKNSCCLAMVLFITRIILSIILDFGITLLMIEFGSVKSICGTCFDPPNTNWVEETTVAATTIGPLMQLRRYRSVDSLVYFTQWSSSSVIHHEKEDEVHNL